jgi:hypothetical protein
MRTRANAAFALTVVAAAAASSLPALTSAADIEWPMSLKPIGDGFPKSGDPCRQVGETAATAPFLDDSATLVACPGKRSSLPVRKLTAATGGRVVGDADGFALISVPNTRTVSDDAPAKTGTLRCVTPGGSSPACAYAVHRKKLGPLTVTVTWPDGRSRSLFFVNGTVRGADTNQADGSAKHHVRSTREADQALVTIGPERYEVPFTAVATE